MHRVLFAMLSLFAIPGCSSYHVDISSEFKISGEIRADIDEEQTSDRKILLSIRDVNLDDSREGEQRLIARHEVNVREEFEFVDSYFWGTTVPDPSAILNLEDEQITIDIELDGCEQRQMNFRLVDLPRENGVNIVDLGQVEIEC